MKIFCSAKDSHIFPTKNNDVFTVIPTACKDAYKKSFFPQTIRDCNVLPDSRIYSAELSDDCISKFTSLVRARD